MSNLHEIIKDIENLKAEDNIEFYNAGENKSVEKLHMMYQMALSRAIEIVERYIVEVERKPSIQNALHAGFMALSADMLDDEPMSTLKKLKNAVEDLPSVYIIPNMFREEGEYVRGNDAGFRKAIKAACSIVNQEIRNLEEAERQKRIDEIVEGIFKPMVWNGCAFESEQRAKELQDSLIKQRVRDFVQESVREIDVLRENARREIDG